MLAFISLTLNSLSRYCLVVKFEVSYFILVQIAIEKLDQQVCESVNKLNAIRHQRKNKQKTLEQLQNHVDRMSKETEEIQKTDIGESPDAQVLIE